MNFHPFTGFFVSFSVLMTMVSASSLEIKCFMRLFDSLFLMTVKCYLATNIQNKDFLLEDTEEGYYYPAEPSNLYFVVKIFPFPFPS